MYDRAKWPTFFATTTAFLGRYIKYSTVFSAPHSYITSAIYIIGLGTDNYSALMQKPWEKEGSTASQ